VKLIHFSDTHLGFNGLDANLLILQCYLTLPVAIFTIFFKSGMGKIFGFLTLTKYLEVKIGIKEMFE